MWTCAACHIGRMLLLPLTAYCQINRPHLVNSVYGHVQASPILNVHAAVYNLFNLGRHLVAANHYRDLRASAFAEWSRAGALI